MSEKKLQLEYKFYNNIDELEIKEKQLVELAFKATESSHSPYSKFSVGAAILLKDGSIVTGSNQENASYGLSICAERTALGAIGSQGKKHLVKIIAVVAKSDILSHTDQQNLGPLTPCGACRQVIKEYEDLSNEPINIICVNGKGEVFSFSSIATLLPFAFGSNDFGFDVNS